jgi:mannose-6-phosphate isomerase-like protein (cupin superfamily)
MDGGFGSHGWDGSTRRVRILGPHAGVVLGALGGVRHRFMVDGKDSGGGFALVEHFVPPRTLAAPLHRHSREDEYSFVLEGRLGAVFDGAEVEAAAGDLVFGPRGEWHTFWNPGDAPTRFLEIFSPGGVEQVSREFSSHADSATPELLAEIAGRYGLEADLEATGALIERHGLVF